MLPILPSKTSPNLLIHLPNTLQKLLQQIPSIHHKLFHEIVCFIQCFPKFRVFSFLLLIIWYERPTAGTSTKRRINKFRIL